MEVILSPERTHFVRRLVADGRFATPEAAVEAAFRLLEESGQASPLRQAVAVGLEQLLAGRSGIVTTDDVTRRSFLKEDRR